MANSHFNIVYISKFNLFTEGGVVLKKFGQRSMNKIARTYCRQIALKSIVVDIRTC